MDTDDFLERMDAKKAAKKEKAAEAQPKKLHIERTPTGLYFVRYDGGGQLPESLKGMFNSIFKLRQAVAVAGKEIAE